MERLGIAATQGYRPDPFRIKWLPADGNLRLLRVILAVRRRQACEESRRQNCRGVVAVPFLALGKVHLKTVETGEVPRGTGDRHTHFFVDSPDIPVHPEALPIHRANRLKRVIERVAIAGEPGRVILAANRKRDWPGGKLKQVAVNSGITYRQLVFA